MPKLQGRLGAMDDVEGVGQRWAEEGLGAGRAGDRAERAERTKRWAERWGVERIGDMAKANMSMTATDASNDLGITRGLAGQRRRGKTILD